MCISTFLHIFRVCNITLKLNTAWYFYSSHPKQVFCKRCTNTNIPVILGKYGAILRYFFVQLPKCSKKTGQSAERVRRGRERSRVRLTAHTIASATGPLGTRPPHGGHASQTSLVHDWRHVSTVPAILNWTKWYNTLTHKSFHSCKMYVTIVNY